MRPMPVKTTCGPTCHMRSTDMQELLEAEIEHNSKLEDDSSTFSVFPGCDTLRRGHRATTYNLTVLDPT